MSAYSIDIATNIENVLLFGVTQHASELLKGEGSLQVDEQTVLLVCVLLGIADTLGLKYFVPYARSSQRVIGAQVIVSIFSSTLLTQIASSSKTLQYTQSDWFSLLTIAKSTVILVVFAFVPKSQPSDTATAYRTRMQGLFLFMYAENLEAQLQRVPSRTVLAACALFVYCIVHAYSKLLSKSLIGQYVARAFNMVAINTILNLAVASRYTDETKTGLLVLVVLSFDVACCTASSFGEIRGYALWKAARYVQQLYEDEWNDPTIALAVCMLGLACMSLRKEVLPVTLSENTIAELVVLVGVNVLVSNTTPDVEADRAARGLVLLLLYLIAWDVVLSQMM